MNKTLLSGSVFGKSLANNLLMYCWLLFSTITLSTGYAQVSRYTFQQSNGTYSEITGGTVLATATATNSFDSQNWSIANGTIPFSFSFNDIPYTGLNINSNGYITFGTTVPAVAYVKPISGTTAYTGAISAFGRDLNASNDNDNGYTGELRYETLGTTGSRIFVIQFKNWNGINRAGTVLTGSAILNFQIRLYEGTSNIEIVYGNCLLSGTYSNATNMTAEIGLRGNSNSDYLTRTNSSTVSFSASTAGVNNAATQNFNYVNAVPGLPSSGLTYSFIPPCIKPNGFILNSVAVNSANITWANPGYIPAEGFEYELRTSGAAGSGATGLVSTATVNANSLILSPLSEGTNYTLYVRSKCSTTDITSWSVGFAFRSGCSTQSLPYNEGFNTTAVPFCWSTQIGGSQYGTKLSFVTSGTNPTVTAPFEGTNMVMYNSFSTANGGSGSKEKLISQPLSTTGINSVDVEFHLYNHNSGTATAEEGVRVQWSTDGLVWNDDTFFKSYGSPVGWNKKLITLPAAAGNQALLYVALQFESQVKYNIFVDDFKVRETPSPLYTSLSSNIESCADSTLITLTGDLLDNSTLIVGSTPITNIISMSRTEIKFYVSAGVTGTLTLTNADGTFTTTEVITVHARPQLSLSTANEAICKMDSTTLITVTSPISNYDTYTWTNPATVSGSQHNGYRLFPATSANYVLTAVKDFGNYTCERKASVLVHVNNAPAVQLENSALTLCENEIIPLKTIASNSALITAGGGPETIGPNPFSHLFGSYRQQTIIRADELRNMGLNAGDDITSIAFKAITVNSHALNDFSIKMKNTAVTSSTYNFDLTNISTVYTVSAYTPAAGFNTFQLDTPFAWDGTSNLMVEFIYSNNNSGGGNPQSTAEYIETMYPSTAFSYYDNETIASFSTSSFARQNVNKRNIFYFGTQQNPLQLPQYVWTGSTSLYANEQATTLLTNENLSKVYYKATGSNEQISVTITDPVTGCFTQDTIRITSNPVIHNIIAKTECDAYNFNGQNLTASGTYHYTTPSLVTGCDSVTTLNLTIHYSTVESISKTACSSYEFNGQVLTASGNYTGVFTNISGCDSTVHLNLTINPPLEASIILEESTLKARPEGSAYTYQWNSCNAAAIAGQTNASFVPSAYGYYSVTVSTQEENCTTTSACLLYDLTGVKTIANELNIQLYPNPTADNITIVSPDAAVMKISITDASGKTVKSIDHVVNGDQINLADVEAGIYLVQISTETTQQVTRVVKK